VGDDGASTVYSAEGTAAHALAEQCLTADKDVPIGVQTWRADGFEGYWDVSDLVAIQAYLDYCRRIPGERLYEVDLPLPDERGGTGDCVILDTDARTIHVIDLKFGKGVAVSAYDNRQLLEYLIGAVRKFDLICDWQYGSAHIVQPRRDWFVSWPYTRDQIETHDFCMAVAADLSSTHAGDIAWMTPGEKQCRWCPISNGCKARANEVISMFQVIK
jgi:hypothetical protein